MLRPRTRRHIDHKLRCLEKMLDKHARLSNGLTWRDTRYLYETEWNYYKDHIGTFAGPTLDQAHEWAVNTCRRFIDAEEARKKKARRA